MRAPASFIIPGLGIHLDDPLVAAHVRDVVDRFATRRGALVISGSEVRLPEPLRAHAMVLRLPAPTFDDYRAVVERVIRDHAARMPVRVELTHVFVVATANDVAALPPEFIQKGRFDEGFFVDLPGPAARRAIFEIHLNKRGHDAARFDLGTLGAASDGPSGAELEQAIVSALYVAFASGAPLDASRVARELSATRPLSRTMAERLGALRDWAGERTVSADGAPSAHEGIVSR